MDPNYETEITRFNELTYPYTLDYVQDSAQAVAARLVGQQTIQRMGARYIRFQQSLSDGIEPGSEFVSAVRDGRFERVARIAGKVAATSVEAWRELQETREGADATGLFAIHAIASCLATVNRSGISDVPHGDDRITYFLTCLASELALRASPELPQQDPEPFAFIQAIKDRTTAMAERFGESSPWMRMKLVTLAERLSVRHHIARLIDSEPLLEVDDLRELHSHNNRLMKELHRLRCYSIKSAVHVDGDVSWSIHDFYDIKAQIMPHEGEGVRPTQWQPAMVMAAFERYGDAVLVILNIDAEGTAMEIAGADIDEKQGRRIFMDADGELYFDMTGTSRLRTLYEQADKIANYEALRQSMIQKMFDLTVPEVIVEEVEAQTNQLLRRPSAIPEDDNLPHDVISDLLLPRIRRLKAFKTIGAFERYAEALEQAAAEQSASGRSASKYKFHDVEAHPRMLPAGYRPSPEALALAKELGIALQEGETLVKKHDRGDAAKGVVVHKAKKKRKTID